jgi:exo-beta-1,3-glucanase (GH17 family)
VKTDIANPAAKRSSSSAGPSKSQRKAGAPSSEQGDQEAMMHALFNRVQDYLTDMNLLAHYARYIVVYSDDSNTSGFEHWLGSAESNTIDELQRAEEYARVEAKEADRIAKQGGK